MAAASGTRYAELLQARVADPLGLASVHVPASAADLWPTDVTGRSARGRAREAWTGEGVGTGVVVLSGTGRSVDRAGFRLLSRLTAGTLA